MDIFTPLFTNTWGILVLILFFGGSIFIHELGHYLAAKWRKLKIERFSIGFGPRLFGWKNKDGVDFRISLLPLGGYVALPQLADMGRMEGKEEGNNEVDEEDSIESEKEMTKSLPLPQISYLDKVIVSAAGAVFNVLFALLVGCILWIFGQPSSEGQQTTVIGYVSPTLELSPGTIVEGPAHKAGLRPGDRVLEIDGRKVRDFHDMQHSIVTGSGRGKEGNPLTIFTILRDGEKMQITVLPELMTINPASGDQVRQIGISPATHMVSAISEDSPAHKAGLRLDDRILSVDGQPIFSIPTLRNYLQQNGEKSVNLGIDRGGNPVEITIQPILVAEKKSTVTLRMEEDGRSLSLHFLPQYEEQQETLPNISASARLILYKIEGDSNFWNFRPRVGDALHELGGISIGCIQDLRARFDAQDETIPVLTLKSGDTLRNLKLTKDVELEVKPAAIQPLLGLVMGGRSYIHLDPMTQVRRHVHTTLQVLGSLLNRNSDIGVRQLSGPIGIGRVFHRFANIDFRLVLVFAVLLNINLAILNMLPIPVLDGGHILFATIAKLRKNPLPINLIVRIQTVFVLLLFSMIIYVGVYDSLRWKGDNEEEERYKILQSLYFDPPIVTNAPKTTPESESQP